MRSLAMFWQYAGDNQNMAFMIKLCQYELIETDRYRCKFCDHKRTSRYPAILLKRRCPERNEKAKQLQEEIEPKLAFGLGDRVSQALSLVGITDDHVSAWLGRPCGCAERREKLNQLGQWVTRVLSGKTDQAKEHLEDMIGSEP